MTASPRTYPRLRAEATDPATPGARLAKLTFHRAREIAALATQNPALPDATLRTLLARGDADAWRNPILPLTLLGAIPENVQDGAGRCLAGGGEPPALAVEVYRNRWNTTTDPLPMLSHLADAALQECNRNKGSGGPLHRRTIRALCLASRWADAALGCTMPRRLRRVEDWAFGAELPPSAPSTWLLPPDDYDVMKSFEAVQVSRSLSTLLTVASTNEQDCTTRFDIPLVPDLANLLRAAIPDPTEGL